VLKRDTKCKCDVLVWSPACTDFSKVAMLYVEKDLSAIAKAVFDQWDSKKHELNHKILYCSNARVSAGDIIACIEKGIDLITNVMRFENS
jgi:hypothetical protein